MHEITMKGKDCQFCNLFYFSVNPGFWYRVRFKADLIFRLDCLKSDDQADDQAADQAAVKSADHAADQAAD